MENERAQAIVRGDAATLERIYADDFSNVGSSGAVRNKEQLIADNKSGALKVESQTLDNVNVRVYGDAAIVTGLATLKGEDKGKDISGQFRFTRVYVNGMVSGASWPGTIPALCSHSARLYEPCCVAAAITRP
ncbi:MAG: nuclear transport factor 2 family protein [Blastocatellia bacterium]